MGAKPRNGKGRPREGLPAIPPPAISTARPEVHLHNPTLRPRSPDRPVQPDAVGNEIGPAGGLFQNLRTVWSLRKPHRKLLAGKLGSTSTHTSPHRGVEFGLLRSGRPPKTPLLPTSSCAVAQGPISTNVQQEQNRCVPGRPGVIKMLARLLHTFLLLRWLAGAPRGDLGGSVLNLAEP